MTQKTSSKTSQPHADNDVEDNPLLDILVNQSIHYSTPEHPITTRDGKPGSRWVINLLASTLETHGLFTAAVQMLELLKRFKGKQIATQGTAAIPLLSACVLLSRGEYNGLLVRKERKAYGTKKLIDGKIDYHEPTIIIDDSIGSGHTMTSCANTLRQEGLYVEGCAVFIRFHVQGARFVEQHRLHIEYLFDMYKDLAPVMPDEPLPIANPAKSRPALVWHDQALDEGLSPFQLVRQCISHTLNTGKLPKPPKHLNVALSSSGGVWISLRETTAEKRSIARAGFYHLPEEDSTTTPQDLVEAAWQIAQQLPAGQLGIERLDNSMITLSLLDQPEPCCMAELDNQHYGIFVRSQERPWVFGGALPAMHGIKHTQHQLHHAIKNNSELCQGEAFDLFRFSLTKQQEPGTTSPISTPSQTRPRWQHDQNIITPYLNNSWQTIKQALADQSLSLSKDAQNNTQSTENLPLSYFNNAAAAFVGLYQTGQLLGCVGAWDLSNDTWIETLSLQALQVALQQQDSQTNSNAWSTIDRDKLAIKLSLLTDAHYLGEYPCAGHMPIFSLGYDAIHVQQGQKQALLLADVAANLCLDEAGFMRMALQKAGISQGNYQATRYNTSDWMMSAAQEPQRLNGLLPKTITTQAANVIPNTFQAWLNYTIKQAGQDGYVRASYQPYYHRYSHPEKDIPLSIHTLRTLHLALPHHAKAQDDTPLNLNIDLDTIWQDIQALAKIKQPAAIAQFVLLLETLTQSPDRAHPDLTSKAINKHIDASQVLWSYVNKHGLIQTSSTNANQSTWPEEHLDIIIALATLYDLQNRYNHPTHEATRIQHDEKILSLYQRALHYAQYGARLNEKPALLRLLTLLVTRNQHLFADTDNTDDTDQATNTLSADDFYSHITHMSEDLIHLQHPDGFLMYESHEASSDTTARICEALSYVQPLARTQNQVSLAEDCRSAIQHGLQCLAQSTVHKDALATFSGNRLALGGLLSSSRLSVINMRSLLAALYSYTQSVATHEQGDTTHD